MHEIWPPDEAVLPANSAIILIGSSLETWGNFGMDPLQASINGQPASVTIDNELSLYDGKDGSYSILALRLQPTPSPGDIVELSGSPCSYDICTPLALQFFVGIPDSTPPPSVTELWWDFVFETVAEEFDSPDSCGDYPQTGYFDIHAKFDLLSPAGELSFSTLNVVSGPGPSSGNSWYDRWVLDTLSFDRSIRFQSIDIPAYEDPAPYCVQMTVRDAAGNSTGVHEQCLPCRIAESVEDRMPDFHFYPGGLCPEGLDGSNEGDKVGDCSTAGHRSLAHWLVLILYLVLWKRR